MLRGITIMRCVYPVCLYIFGKVELSDVFGGMHNKSLSCMVVYDIGVELGVVRKIFL